MPLTVLDNVPFSEMKGNNTHQGPRTAGNKSMLAYRSDIGIPGYTGYCPGWTTVPVPINGSNKHTGRLPDEKAVEAELQRMTLQDDQRHAASEYRARYTADPSNYKVPGKTGGGFWFEERQRAAAGNTAPFSSSTTYADEMLKGQETVQQQRQQLEGLPSTLVNYQVARQHRTHSASPTLTRRGSGLSSTTAATSTGDLLGYKTTYSAQNKPLEQARQAAAAAATQRPASCPGGGAERLRMAVMPSVTSCKRFEGSSTYCRDFGLLGSDPMAHATTVPSLQTLSSTTRELNEGSTRAAHHPPGFTGFIPAAATNSLAVQQGAGTDSRPNAKQAMLSATLDQYSRSVVKGYTGYKPRGGPAATAVLPQHGPTAETTQGFVNLQVQRQGPQAIDHSHCINSRAGLMSFFTGGSESVSDNGLADAQKFFVGRRPYGGRMKHV